MKGLCARGGFVVDEQWQGGKLVQAVVRSRIGGVLRLRSYVPLTGKGLKAARGACRNPLLTVANVKTPIVAEVKEPGIVPDVRQVYEYDVQTKAGETVVVEPRL